MSDIIRTVLIMSISGGVIAVLLFALKPFARDRLPKSVQYYLWLVVIAALLVPVSKLVALPESQTLPIAPIISDTVSRYVITQDEELDRIMSIPTPVEKDDAVYPQLRREAESPLSTATTVFIKVYPFAAAGVLLYFILSYAAFVVSHRRRRIAAEEADFAMLEQLRGGRRAPRLYRSSLTATPMLIGVFRPMIILPDRKYTDIQLRAVLLHELTHWRRKDVFIKWLTVLVFALHWFNPIIWLVRREINRACELSCDEAIISGLDVSGKQKYGDTLLYVAADSKTPRAILSTTMCEEKKVLKERLGAIMKNRRHTRAAILCSIVLLTAAILTACALGAGRTANNDAPPTPDAATPAPVNNVIPTPDLTTPEPAVSYRELNKFLTVPQEFPGLINMTDEEQLISFAAFLSGDVAAFLWGTEPEAWGARFSKEAVEAILNRYFGIEEINHEKSSLYRSWEDWDVDYPIDGIAPHGFSWIYVSDLRDLGDGTYSADADVYWVYDWDDSYYDHISQWKMKEGARIFEVDGWDDRDFDLGDIENFTEEDVNIYHWKASSCTVTVRPFVYNGEDTWQIVAINGVEVPKVLFP